MTLHKQFITHILEGWQAGGGSFCNHAKIRQGGVPSFHSFIVCLIERVDSTTQKVVKYYSVAGKIQKAYCRDCHEKFDPSSKICSI